MDEGAERIARGVRRGRRFEIEVDGKLVVAQLASVASGRPVESFGSASVRPPVKPILMGDLARGARQ